MDIISYLISAYSLIDKLLSTVDCFPTLMYRFA